MGDIIKELVDTYFKVYYNPLKSIDASIYPDHWRNLSDLESKLRSLRRHSPEFLLRLKILPGLVQIETEKTQTWNLDELNFVPISPEGQEVETLADRVRNEHDRPYLGGFLLPDIQFHYIARLIIEVFDQNKILNSVVFNFKAHNPSQDEWEDGREYIERPNNDRSRRYEVEARDGRASTLVYECLKRFIPRLNSIQINYAFDNNGQEVNAGIYLNHHPDGCAIAGLIDIRDLMRYHDELIRLKTK